MKIIHDEVSNLFDSLDTHWFSQSVPANKRNKSNNDYSNDYSGSEGNDHDDIKEVHDIQNDNLCETLAQACDTYYNFQQKTLSRLLKFISIGVRTDNLQLSNREANLMLETFHFICSRKGTEFDMTSLPKSIETINDHIKDEFEDCSPSSPQNNSDSESMCYIKTIEYRMDPNFFPLLQHSISWVLF